MNQKQLDQYTNKASSQVENAQNLQSRYAENFDRVIILVRNPFDVSFSSFHYFSINSTHTSRRVSADGSITSVPIGTAIATSKFWKKHIQYWLDHTVSDSSRFQENETITDLNNSLPVRLIIRYEDLQVYPRYYVKKISDWLGVSIQPSSMDCALSKADAVVRIPMVI